MKITKHDTPGPVLHDRANNDTRRRCGGCGHTVAVTDGSMFWRGTVRRWLCNICQKKP